MKIYRFKMYYEGKPYAEFTAPSAQDAYNILGATCTEYGCPDLRQAYAEAIGEAYDFDGTVSEWYEAVKEGRVD